MAAITTYAELVAAVKAFATFRQDAQIPYFVTWAQQEIGRRLRAPVMLTRADVAISGEFAPVPADFAAVKTFRLDTSPRRALRVSAPEVVEDRIGQGATQAYPELVAIEGEEFHFAPGFTATPTGKLLYYAIPGALAADGDTNAVLLKYPMLYLSGALENLYRFMEDDNNADRWGQQFGAMIEDINSREAKDAMSGPIEMSVAPGGIV